MEAILATRPRAVHPAPLLRFGLIADAVASGATGLLTLVAGPALAPVFGLPAGLLQGVGLVCITWAAFIGWLARRETLPVWLIWTVLALNLVWVADSFLLLVSGWVVPTALGVGFAAAQALAVAGLTALQWMGLRRSQA
jgi:hypothetical protein